VARVGKSSHHLLIVAGPGAGKSLLFLSRAPHWLALDGERRAYVATTKFAAVKANMVRKLSTEIGVIYPLVFPHVSWRDDRSLNNLSTRR
jgi:hypothetical protein